MSLLFNVSVVKCIKRCLTIVKCKNVNQMSRTFYKSETSILISNPCASSPIRTTTANTIIFGFSLLGLFGLDEAVDPELKLINTIKRGLLYLQVNFQIIDIVLCYVLWLNML